MIRRAAALCLIPALLISAACSDKPDAKKPDEAADKVAAAAKVRRPIDPGALLVQEASRAESTRQPDEQAQVAATLTHADHTYVAVPLSASLQSWALMPMQVDVKADGVHGIAVASERLGQSPQQATTSFALVRFAGPAPATFTLTLRTAQHNLGASPPFTGSLTTVAVTTPKKPPADAALAGTFYAALSTHLAMRGQHAFYTFAAQRVPLLATQGGLSKSRLPEDVARGMRRGDIGSTMALYTGLNAVEESLQYDRGLMLRGEPTTARTVPLAQLEGVKLAAHPWDKLIAALPSKPVIEPMASIVPADMAYLHFHDLRELSRLSGELDGWLTPLVRVMERRAEDAELVARYEDQLALRKTKLSEQLGHVATQGVAIVTSDPFLREGSDLTVIFHTRNKPVLDGALDKLLAERAAERPDHTTSQYALGQHSVTHTRTADGHIERHRLDLGEHVLVSNSRRALEQIVAASEGKLPSLASSGDFKYMRARYPFDVKQEAGFLFIGDAFVADAISPRSKILSSRRMHGVADVRAVNHAALLFGWMEGRQPRDIAEVVKAGLLDSSELEHDGVKLSWTPERGAYSPAWGTIRVQRPLIDQDLDLVTAEEARAYSIFRESYQQYWRAFIDPVAVRITRSDDGTRLAFDGRMLPIIDSSEYNELIALTGERNFVPGQPFGAVQWTFALGDDARLRRDLSQLLSSSSRNSQLTLDWIGDWIAVGAADRGALWDLLLYFGSVAGDRDAMRDQARKKRIDEIALLARLPVYAMIHIKSPAVLAAALTALRKEVDGAAPGMVIWGTGLPYREIATVAIGENLLQTGRVGLPIQLHYATVKGVFVAAMDRAVLEQCIDQILDDRGPTSVDPADPSAAAAQTEVVVRPWPEQSWLLKTGLGMLESDARWGFEASLSYWEIMARGLGRAPTDAEALAHLGRTLARPHGQPLAADADGKPTHPIYGGHMAPAWPKLPVAGSPVTAAVEALRLLRMDMSFEGQGEDRGIHARVEIIRAK